MNRLLAYCFAELIILDTLRRLIKSKEAAEEAKRDVYFGFDSMDADVLDPQDLQKYIGSVRTLVNFSLDQDQVPIRDRLMLVSSPEVREYLREALAGKNYNIEDVFYEIQSRQYDQFKKNFSTFIYMPEINMPGGAA